MLDCLGLLARFSNRKPHHTLGSFPYNSQKSPTRTPNIVQDVHAVFLKQIAESDPDAQRVVLMDQAEFYMQVEDEWIPANTRVKLLPQRPKV